MEESVTVDAVPRVVRYQFDADTEKRLAELGTLDNWHGPLGLAADWALIIGVSWLGEVVSGPWWWPTYLLVVLPVIGTRQRALATLLHEATHGTLARTKWWNMFLGTVPSAHLVLQTHRAYARSHLRGHHGSFGDPDVDPDFRAHLKAGLYTHRGGKSFLFRFLVAPLFGVRTPALIKELAVTRFSGTLADLWGSVGAAGYFAAVAAVFTVSGHGRLFLCYWVVPLLVVFPLVNWYIELLEHFPLVGDESVDIRATRHRAVGPISRHFFGIHAEGFHLDHHLSPKIPFWNLRRAHEIRMADTRYRAAVLATAPAEKGLLWQFADIIRRVDQRRIAARIGSYAAVGEKHE